MDCHKAQAELEFGLGKELPGTPEVQAARRHVVECQGCRTVLDSQLQFDTRVARAMNDVPVPQGLADRLKASVGAESVRPMTTSGGHGTSSGSMRMIRWTAIAALCLVPLLILPFVTQGPVLNEAGIHRLAEARPEDARDAAQVAFAAPHGWTASRSLQLAETPRLSSINRINAPILDFLLRTDRRSSHVTGMLVRLKPSEWSEPLEERTFATSEIRYAAFGTWVAWREGDSVYVCILREDAQVMQRLQLLIAGGRQFT